jgi:60 kDa SS-A/Ro ribonucleoprotein
VGAPSGEPLLRGAAVWQGYGFHTFDSYPSPNQKNVRGVRMVEILVQPSFGLSGKTSQPLAELRHRINLCQRKEGEIMKHLLKALNPNLTPQTSSLRADQTRNNAGGFVWKVSDEGRFLRFLILGTEGATYYASEAKQTKLESEFVKTFVTLEGVRAVQIIREVARDNRAPKADTSLLALAAVAKLGSLEARKAAWDALPEVARTGTHLLHFLEFVQLFGGWGRLTRGGVAKLYNDMPLEKLAIWAVKYKARDGWSQADALRLAHPKTADVSRNAIYKFIVDGVLDGEATDAALGLIRGHLLALEAKTDANAAALMREYRLPIEAVPTHLRGERVYRMALETNGITWALRNLGNLGRIGLLKPGKWDVIEQVVARVTDEVAIKKGRVHPIDALKAMLVYGNGKGVRRAHARNQGGSGEWAVVPQVKDALETAFYKAFGAVKPTGKRFVLGLDVSGSMTTGAIAGVPGLTPNLGSTAMAMVTLRSETNAHVMGFGDSFRDLGIRPKDTLEAALAKTQNQSFGATDCALPMIWAMQNKVVADAFVIYTDNETWHGKIHPAKALEQYRHKMGVDARLIVVGMTATGFTIADPKDAGMLDVVGFDGSAPNLISSFVKGEF